MRDIVVFCGREGYYGFLKPYIDSFAGDSRFQFIIEKERRQDRLAQHMGKDCTIWIDGFDEFAIWASTLDSDGKTKVVCRLTGTEVLDVDWQRCRWEGFDAIVTSNRASEAVVFDCVDRLESMTQYTLLPPAVSVSPFNVTKKRATKSIAYLGALSLKNNSLALLDILTAVVARDKEYKLFVIGEFASTSLRIHFEHALAARELAQNIEFHERPENLAAWFEDKSFILSTSLTAGNEAETVLAMSFGVQPIVVNHFGAEYVTGDECLANSVSECVERILSGPAPYEQLRQRAIEQHNVMMRRSQFEDVISGVDLSYKPKVSILLPTYNRADLLKKTLERLSQQTYQNVEVVVVNDCSSDGTDDVVLEAQKTRKDIVYFRNEINQGNANSMAFAAAKASGDFVIPFSDDDDLDDRALEEFVRFWKRKKSDIIYCDLVVTDSKGVEQTRWQYRNYYRTYELLNTLVMADGNKIPETFFCRRELYDQIYMQTYSRRFLNTYYLPHLRKLKMIHLPLPLYRYAVHTGSTFSNAIGLFDRSKSTQNYINAAMFMYSPARVMNTDTGRPPAQQIAEAYISLAQVLTEHGKKRISGSIYTGAAFTGKDNLHQVYYHNAFHWAKMAQRYGYPVDECTKLINKIRQYVKPEDFKPREHANLPDAYLRLPWFAHKAFNNLSRFVALDIVTIGAPNWLNKERYTIYEEGKAHLEVCNHRCHSGEEFAALMSKTPVTIVNIFDVGALEPTIRYLIENQLASVHVFNFSRIRVPEIDLLKTVFHIGPRSLRDFNEYLELVTELSTTSNYEHCTVEAAV
ncbi:MAG: glycosyltransferase [Candidatus Zixiibacteriota bacterium]